jgi:hypothetical protein
MQGALHSSVPDTQHQRLSYIQTVSLHPEAGQSHNTAGLGATGKHGAPGSELTKDFKTAKADNRTKQS